MPELPEVETIVRDLRPVLVGKKIVTFKVTKQRLLKNPLGQFKKFMIGATIFSVGRRAKLVLIGLSSGYTLLIHLKMTGQLVWRGSSGKIRLGGHPIVGVAAVPNRYTYITLGLAGGGKLYFNDVRTFGYFQLVKSELLAKHHLKFGPEPLTKNFTAAVLRQRLHGHPRVSIKAALLNQAVLAGLGNIYVDESLFAAGLKPSRRVGKLKSAEFIKLWSSIKQILSQAVRTRGTSFNNYRDGFGRKGTYWEKRWVYGRRGEPCRRCSRPISRTVLAGRGTHYCSNCQR
ncbi:MAG: bifunctional DNA-formamidopyrimidine glycosylase/DNA-(apurinic or apyrimidinic site) lyase [Candidatus Kerfeldbacteria bacterium]|nr:bifunctional DNA-formamidopyrimidine glycosylase/DNA-(apurinic or apyrimidinic site) lyase [Candidatus Kerfeldbacteria bacterium]